MNTGILTFRQKMAVIGRFSLPYAVFLVFFIMNLGVFKLIDDVLIRIPLLLMSIFHWSLFRPKLVPHYFAFLIGLAFDIFSGMPLGLNALLFVVVQWFVKGQRHVLTGQSFMALWVGFAMVLGPALLIEWLVMSVFFDVTFNVMIPLSSYGVGLCVFPFALFILSFVQKTLPQQGLDLEFRT